MLSPTQRYAVNATMIQAAANNDVVTYAKASAMLHRDIAETDRADKMRAALAGHDYEDLDAIHDQR